MDITKTIPPHPSSLLCNEVTAEGCKNLLLAGVSATLCDEATVTPADIGANFLLEGGDVGENVRNDGAIC